MKSPLRLPSAVLSALGPLVLAGLVLVACTVPQDEPDPGPATSFVDGTYTPPWQVALGTYRAVVAGGGAPASCYWQIRSGPGDNPTIRANAFGDPGQTVYLRLRVGDREVTTDGCGTWYRVSEDPNFSPTP